LNKNCDKDATKLEFTIHKHILCEFTPMFINVMFIYKHEPVADTASQHEYLSACHVTLCTA
jgi:hypothetical protein